MDTRKFLFQDYRHATFILSTTVLSSLALTPTATIVPGILALSTLHVYARFLFPSSHRVRNGLLLWFGMSLGGAVPNLFASLDAFDTTAISLVLLSCISALVSAFAVAAVYVDWAVSRKLTSAWPKLVLFPAVWATIWSGVAYLSPVGHLLTWSRANNIEGYRWLIPIFGPSTQDWVEAAWAVVISEIFQSWYMGSCGEDEPNEEQKKSSKSHTPLLASCLALLLVPSFFTGSLPLPVTEIEVATPLGVGCINPSFHRYGHHAPTLKDYIDESKKYTSLAKVLLWPEGAVSFNSDAERDAAFLEIRSNITGSYVGVSFEQLAADPNDSTGRKGYKRTGIAVLHQDSPEPYLLYYKRHLVPVVESYHLAHSLLPPTLANLSITRPKDIPPSQWSPTPDHTRILPITASVCLDFAIPSPFGELDQRPALILAPARTWERSVGVSMWLQAKQRAAELNSMILWCDGGESGVSGIAGGGFEDFNQIGKGSWVKTIGIQYPFNDAPTFYSRFGKSPLLMYWILACGPLFVGGINFSMGRGILDLVHRLLKSRRGVQLENNVQNQDPLAAREQPALIDF